MSHPAAEPSQALVTITVNTVEHQIHRGHQTVARIKEVGGVPPGDALEQVINGQLVPLDDAGSVVIKGGEVFMSHPKDSGSSAH